MDAIAYTHTYTHMGDIGGVPPLLPPPPITHPSSHTIIIYVHLCAVVFSNCLDDLYGINVIPHSLFTVFVFLSLLISFFVSPPFFVCQVTYKIFQRVGFFEAFKIPEKKFLEFFFTLESGYHEIPCEWRETITFIAYNKNNNDDELSHSALYGCLSALYTALRGTSLD